MLYIFSYKEAPCSLVEWGVAQKEKDQNVLPEFSDTGLAQRLPGYQLVDNWLMFKNKLQMSKSSMHSLLCSLFIVWLSTDGWHSY